LAKECKIAEEKKLEKDTGMPNTYKKATKTEYTVSDLESTFNYSDNNC
jgi:hypothetical protein